VKPTIIECERSSNKGQTENIMKGVLYDDQGQAFLVSYNAQNVQLCFSRSMRFSNDKMRFR